MTLLGEFQKCDQFGVIFKSVDFLAVVIGCGRENFGNFPASAPVPFAS